MRVGFRAGSSYNLHQTSNVRRKSDNGLSDLGSCVPNHVKGGMG